MIQLKPMTPEAYEHFTGLSMVDFAEAKSRAERLSLDEGHRIARDAWSSLLPQGQHTPLHHFYTAWNEDQDIGMVWFKEERNWETPYGYLYQVWVWEQFQRQGYGKALMIALEEKLKLLGLPRLRLHVFAFNERAIGLYEKLGFETTNIVMVKELS
jgi:ribosomal protein S18 acetylase RimI-like enzyme